LAIAPFTRMTAPLALICERLKSPEASATYWSARGEPPGPTLPFQLLSCPREGTGAAAGLALPAFALFFIGLFIA
jgi:hypothetical protein